MKINKILTKNKFFFLFFALFLCFSNLLFAGTYKVNRADFKVVLNPEKAFVKGVADLDISFPQRNDKAPFLGLWKTLRVDETLIFENNQWSKIPFQRKGILIIFPEMKPGRNRLKISYSGKLPDAKVSSDETVTGEKLSGFTRTALAKGFGQLVVDDYWHPWVPRMQEPQDIRGCKLTIALPDNYEAIATGQLISKKAEFGVNTTSWKIGKGLRAGGFSLFYSSHHKLIQQVVSGIKIGVFIPEKNIKLADKFISTVGDIISHHSRVLFPYPYQSQTLVFSDLFPSRWGYGKYSETVVIASDFCEYFQSLSPEKASVSAFTFFAHEIAHHWYGILINNSPIMCFVEGVPEVMSGLACREVLGKEAEKLWQDRVLSELKRYFDGDRKDFPLERDLEEYAVDPEKDPIIFQGAKDLQVTKFPLFLLKAKKILGSKNFYRTMKTFSLKHVGINKIKETSDLLEALPSEVSSSQRSAIRELFSVKFDSFEELVRYLD